MFQSLRVMQQKAQALNALRREVGLVSGPAGGGAQGAGRGVFQEEVCTICGMSGCEGEHVVVSKLSDLDRHDLDELFVDE